MTSLVAPPSPPRKRLRTRKLAAGITLPVLALSLALPAFAAAQEVQGSGNRHFKQAQAQSQSQTSSSGSRHFTSAPVPKDPAEQDSIRDMVGISTNAAFFTAVAMIALFWFTIGGGRRAKKLGRQE